jgi:glyoxylase-like metal-dependent hydrolase (beta-lactamase superfamily II)
MVDRRQFLVATAATLVSGVVSPRRAVAQQAGRVALDDRLSVLTSGRTNVVALSTSDGLVLVDSGAPDLSNALMTDVTSLSAGRISTVFNTHWHPENTGANEALQQAGATILAHENTRLWMATPTWIPAEDRYRQPRPRGAHPTKTFYANGSMTAGGETIEYGYLIEAHTSSDIYVFFRNANVLAVGDVAAPVQDPVLDYFTGAWIGGRLDALTRLVELSDDRTRIVPGFGPVMTRAELQAERDMMKTIYDRTVDRVREGDDVEDMLNAGVLTGLRAFKDPQTFIHDVHKGLWAHHNKLSPNVV